MSEELNNESINTPEVEASASEPEAKEQVSYSDVDINAKVSEALNSNEDFKKFQQYQNFLNSNKEESNPFSAELGLGNLPDAAKYLYENLGTTQQKLQEFEQKAAYLEAKEAQRDYEAATNQFNEYWTSRYTDQESFNNAFMEAISRVPELKTKFETAKKQGYGLDANFIAHTHQAMANLWLSKLDDPNSGVLDALIAEHSKKKALKDQSMLSSNSQTTDSGRTQDRFSSRLTILDD